MTSMAIPQMTPKGDKDIAHAMSILNKRPRGRPKKSEVRAVARVKKWVPKKWKPMYEQIVALDIAGLPHANIAVRFNKTVQYISKICNTPQALMIKKNALNILVEKNKEFQEERFSHTQAKAMERITDLMENDDLFAAEPFQIVDKAFKLLQNSGALAAEKSKEAGDMVFQGPVTVNNLTQTAVLDLKEGLAKAREAGDLHAGMEAIDVTSPKVDSGRME